MLGQSSFRKVRERATLLWTEEKLRARKERQQECVSPEVGWRKELEAAGAVWL